MSCRTCMSFFLLWNTKEHSLKNVGNQIVSGPIDFHIFCPYNGSQWDLKPFDYKHSPKYSIFFWRKKCIQVFIFGWTIPLSECTEFWLVSFMGLINPSDNILGGVDTASHFLLFSPQGKKGRPGEDGTPGAKGQKVSICFYYCCLSVILPAVCLLLWMHMGNVMRKLMVKLLCFCHFIFLL